MWQLKIPDSSEYRMPKIDRDTLIILPRTNIKIYKLENGKNYYCKFYVGNGFKKINQKDLRDV